MKKNSTVFLVVGGSQAFSPYSSKITPLPSLDAIYGLPIPLYDYEDKLTADTQKFTAMHDKIATTQNEMHGDVISMSVLSAFFLVLGIVAITVYKIKDPKRKQNNSLMKVPEDDQEEEDSD